MRIKIYSRANLIRTIEDISLSDNNLTIAQLLKNQCPQYRDDIRPYLSIYSNGELIEYEDWFSFNLSNTKELMIIIEAGGLETTAIVAIIAAVVAVSSVVYSLVMMNKLDSPTTGNTKTGSTIYDVNAQGNKVKLQSVIPENFGYFKKYPDYLCEMHSFYRHNKYFLDLILSQGRGYYEHSGSYDDIYLANTPLSRLDDGSVQVRIYEPGTEITALNSIEDRCWYGWYSSIEVTKQGKTLNGLVAETESSDSVTYSTTFGQRSVTCYKITYQYTGSFGCSGTNFSYIPIRSEYSLPWDVDSYFKISGTSNVRSIGVENDDYTTQEAQDTVTLYLTKTPNITDLSYLRARVTSIDPDTQEEIIESAGDIIRVTYSRNSIVKYVHRPSGTSGPYQDEAIATNTEEFDAEILEIALVDDLLTITVDANEAVIPQYPDYPSVEALNIIQQSRTDTINAYEPRPADYPYETDNGLYIIVSKDGATTNVARVTSSYAVDTNWTGFWSQGFSSDNVSFELDENSLDNAGEWVGPYLACPVGASSNMYELDIVFPSGLGTLNNSGNISNRTVSIEIQYRESGSNGQWTSVTREWTNNTNDELAYTVEITTVSTANYEFRVKNLSDYDENIQALQTVKWTGLKSCITTKNIYEDITVIICRFKGTETLSELSQNQIWTLWTRKLPTIETSDANLNNPEYMVATRDIAPVVKYICDNSKYRGILNIDSLREYDTYWRSKGLKLDGTLDNDNTLLEALKDILKAGFSNLTVYGNKLSFCKLHKQGDDEPLVQIFTPQNLTASPKATITFRRDDSVNEIVVEYIDPTTYKTATRYVHLDSNGDSVVTLYPTSNNQERLNAFGVVQENVAVAMACRRLRYLIYTNTKYEISTELDGLNCQYNDLVGLVLDHNLSNITGRVISVNNNVITVDRQIPRNMSSGVVYIRKLDGSVWQTTFSRTSSRELNLDANLPFAWNPDYGTVLEYPFFAIGELIKCWVTDIRPTNKSCTLELVNYDERVFDDDL